MHINKAYLKLGVAFTATLGFGFMLGRIYEQSHIQKAMRNFKQSMRETAAEMGRVEEAIKAEESETPVEEPEEVTVQTKTEVTVQTKTVEDEEMARKRKVDVEEAIRRVRLDEFTKRLMNMEESSKTGNGPPWTALASRDIPKLPDEVDNMVVEDSSPWGCPLQHPLICLVFDKTHSEFYTTDPALSMAEIDVKDFDEIVYRLFTYPANRTDGDGKVHHGAYSVVEYIQYGYIMPYDDRHYDKAIRCVYFPDMELEGVIFATEFTEESAGDQEVINHIINNLMENYTVSEYDEE